jgi:hypothetical protein
MREADAALAFLAWMLVAMRNDASPQGILPQWQTLRRHGRDMKAARKKSTASWRVSLIRECALRKVVVPSSVDTAAIPRGSSRLLAISAFSAGAAVPR